MKDRSLLFNIPYYNLAIHGAASEYGWLSRVPSDFGHTVWHFDILSRLLRVKGSSKRIKDADDRLMLTPRNVISFAVSYSQ